MTGKIKEATQVLLTYLDYAACDMCSGNCSMCRDHSEWSLSDKAAEMLVNKIDECLAPTGTWKKYDDNEDYYCSNCSWVAPRDAYGRFSDLTPHCCYCGAKMKVEE